MPNGFHGSREKWDALEAPLRGADELLQRFADRIGARLEKNERNWPARSIAWGEPIRRQIWLLPDAELEPVYELGVMAAVDHDLRRYGKRARLVEGAPWGEVGPRLDALLEEAYAIGDAWTEADLEFWVDLPDLR